MTHALSANPNLHGLAWGERVTLEAYQRLWDSGVFPPESRTELIEGEIYFMGKIGKQHAGIVNYLSAQAFRLLGSVATIAIQNPVQVGVDSIPQPDLAILKQDEHFYRQQEPVAADVHLLIEVSDSTLWMDTGRKCKLYAAALIPEYWVIDIPHQLVHQFTDPQQGDYTQHAEYQRGQAITSKILPTFTLSVNDILGVTA
jgi:Uma2 family endonuclease